ncbi:MAG: PQQ-binding-like beta-propeller repeat protein [Pirellulaceae bacterium]
MNLRPRMPCAALVVWLSLTLAAAAEDWPQWMGPNRDGQWRETGILETFPDGRAKILWRTPIAGGYAGPAVAAGKVYVTDYVRSTGEATNDPDARAESKGQERVLCLNAADGKPLWKHEYDCTYKISYPAGPRATPTVAGGKVYTLGAEGKLLCLSADTGKVVWQKELTKEYQIETPMWGFCAHPLVDGNKLICLVGGAGSVAVAFDKESGKELWKSLAAPAPGYCPPTIIEAGGARQLLIWHTKALNSLNPETGEVYWSEPLEAAYGMPIAAPRQAGDYLFASAIGSVAALFELDRTKPAVQEVWLGEPNTAVYCANSTPLIEAGTIYGNDCQVGNLRAVDLKTGKRLWETFVPTTGGERRASHGTAFLTKNGDRYFLFSETGDLIIARLTPQGYDEISRAHVIEPTGEAFGRQVVWSHPAYAGRCAFVRNDKEIVCVSLAK